MDSPRGFAMLHLLATWFRLLLFRIFPILSLIKEYYTCAHLIQMDTSGEYGIQQHLIFLQTFLVCCISSLPALSIVQTLHCFSSCDQLLVCTS
jgi:hypothetical protein